MDGKPSVVNVICLVAEKVEELGIHDRHDEIEGVVGIGNDDEQRRLPVSDGVKLHLIVAHQLPQLCDVEGRKPCTAGNQNRLSGFARDEKSRTFSSNSKRSHILRTSSRSRRLILSSIVSFAVWLKCTRTI